MCRDSDTPVEIMRFSCNPEYIENEVIHILISLKTDFQLLFNSDFRIKTFSDALDEYRKNIGVKKGIVDSTELLAEIFRNVFDRDAIIDRIYSSICTLNTLLNSDGFMKLSREKKNKLYSEVRSTIDYIQNIIMKRMKIRTLQ